MVVRLFRKLKQRISNTILSYIRLKYEGCEFNIYCTLDTLLCLGGGSRIVTLYHDPLYLHLSNYNVLSKAKSGEALIFQEKIMYFK